MAIRRKFKTFIFLLMFISVDLLSSYAWFQMIQRHNTDSDWTMADVGVVFMGDFNDNNSGLGPETLRRVQHAAELYKKGKIKQIYAAGGARPSRGIFGSVLIKNELIGRGIAADRLISEQKSYSTFTNLDIFNRWQSKNKIGSAVLISSPMHLQRIRRIVDQISDWPGSVYYSAYQYNRDGNLFELWRQIHYEWSAIIATETIPRQWSQKWIGWARR